MPPFWAKGAGHRRLQAPAPVLQAPWCRNWSCSCPSLMEPAVLLASPAEHVLLQESPQKPSTVTNLQLSCRMSPSVPNTPWQHHQNQPESSRMHNLLFLMPLGTGNPLHCVDSHVAGAVGDTMEKSYFLHVHPREAAPEAQASAYGLGQTHTALLTANHTLLTQGSQFVSTVFPLPHPSSSESDKHNMNILQGWASKLSCKLLIWTRWRAVTAVTQPSTSTQEGQGLPTQCGHRSRIKSAEVFLVETWKQPVYRAQARCHLGFWV